MFSIELIIQYFKITGGAINQAKGALSNWWSNLTTNQMTGTAIDDAELPPGDNSIRMSQEELRQESNQEEIQM